MANACCSVDPWDQLDLARLRALIESSFGRTLAADYFERTTLHARLRQRELSCRRDPYWKRTCSMPANTYLDKFAVLDDAQGEGLGRAVWQVMRDETPQSVLALASRQHHQSFLLRRVRRLPTSCRSGRRSGTASDGFDEIEACIDYCREKAPTLIDREPAVLAEQAM